MSIRINLLEGAGNVCDSVYVRANRLSSNEFSAKEERESIPCDGQRLPCTDVKKQLKLYQRAILIKCTDSYPSLSDTRRNGDGGRVKRCHVTKGREAFRGGSRSFRILREKCRGQIYRYSRVYRGYTPPFNVKQKLPLGRNCGAVTDNCRQKYFINT